MQPHVQGSSVAQLCLTFCNPMDCSMPGFPVHHHLPELAQIHVHRVSDPTILSSVIPFSSCLHSFPEQGPFQRVGSLQQVAKVLELQHQSFQ